jgi:3'(2'), 5'-bisphosphate nucleotidase
MLEAVVEIAKQAGEIILKEYQSSDAKIVSKDDGSPLTRADLASHDFISKELLSRFGLPVLSEEDSIAFSQRKHWSRFWLVDPLDGTKEFINKNGEFTVNIALVEHGLPVLGVVSVPAMKTTYFASKGEGAFKSNYSGNTRIFNSRKGSGLICVVSRSHLDQSTLMFCKEKGVSEFVQAGSSLKLCLVAEGQADFYPRFAPTSEWDIAAGHAILLEAGCELYSAKNGHSLSYNKEDILNPSFIAQRNGLFAHPSPEP